MSNIYTWQQVAKHNNQKDLWIVINDKVYDVTQYQKQHPGGPIVLINRAGKNASLAFEQASHSKVARQVWMPKSLIGKIDPNSIILDYQKQAQSSAPNIFVTIAVVTLILAAIYLLAQ